MPSSELGAADAPAGRRDASATGAASAASDPPEIVAAIRRVQAGDDEAFEDIHAHFGPALKQFFLNRRLSETLAQDLYQECLLKAWQQIQQYRFDGPFAAWLQRIGENLWKNDRRAWETQKRKMAIVSLETQPSAGAGEDDRPLFGDRPVSPEAAVAASEQVRQVQAALDQLPPGQRRCIELRYTQELKYREVAELLGVTTGSVQSQVHEGLNRLRYLLGTGAGGGEP